MSINFIPKIVYNAGAGDVTLSFSYPPELDPLSESITSNGSEAISNSGETQFNLYYLQKDLTLNFKVLTKSQIDALRTFFTSWALLGNTFKYYPSASESDYETFMLSKKEFKPIRSSPDGSNDFFYKLTIALKRVYP